MPLDVFRGNSVAFETTFLDIDGAPLVPADANLYPQISIQDPDGTVVTTGVGSPLGNGQFRFNWFCPENATQNTNDTAWCCTWFFVTAAGHSKSTDQKFSVVDKIESEPDELKQTYLTHDGGCVRLLIRRPTRLLHCALVIKPSSNTTAILHHVDRVATNAAESASTNPNRLITESNRSGQYVYYYDTDAMTAGEYLVFWSIQEAEDSDIDTLVQIIRVVPDIFWHYAVDLKMLLDKLQKLPGMRQAYADPDFYSYLKSGIDTINFYAPSTNWILSDIPLDGSRGVRGALIYASAIHGLIAQQILEEELSFEHTGQTVTLSVKHDYSGVITAIGAQLEKFALAKPMIFRLSEGVGVSGVRPKNWRLNQRVWRIDRGMQGLVPPGSSALLRNIGL